VVIVIVIARARARRDVRLWTRRRIVRLVSCKFRGTARKSGVHTRTAYKLIPLCRAIEEEGRRAEANTSKKEIRERERARERERERERGRERGIEKKLAGGSYYEPGSRSHACARGFLGPRISPRRRRRWPFSFREIFLARVAACAKKRKNAVRLVESRD